MVDNDKIANVAESYNVDESEVEEVYEEKLEQSQEDAGDSVPEKSIRMQAFALTKSEFRSDEATGGNGGGGSGDSKEVNIISLGYNDMGKHEWSSGETYVYGYGIAKPGDEDPHPAVFLLQQADVGDLDAMMDKFGSPLNSLQAEFSVSTSSSIDEERYVLNTVEDTDVAETDSPMSFEERREWVADFLPDVPLTELADNLTATNSDGFTEDFGVDFRRFRGSIVEATIDGDGQWGVYTVQDDSFVDEAELDEEITGEQGYPGVSIWSNPDMMEYGEHSIVDFVGTIERGENGQITMSASTIIPIMSNDIDLNEATLNSSSGSGGSSSNTEAREQSI